MKDNKDDKIYNKVREIEFRAKDITDKWQYGSLIKEEYLDCDMNSKNLGKFASCYFIRTRDDKDWTAHYGSIPVEVETIGQFTGLCDKNGKKIYEGDVVVYQNYDKLFFRGVVEYLEEVAMFVARFKVGLYSFMHMEFGKIELIGNIHDNPEMWEEYDEKPNN